MPTPIQQTRPAQASDLHKWLDLGLLVVSGGAILAVAAWVESALVG